MPLSCPPLHTNAKRSDQSLLRQLRPVRQPRGFTLIELIVALAMIVCAIKGSAYGHHYIGHWYGFLLGGILGVASPLGLVFAWAILMDLAWGGIPRLPKCRNGCCHGPVGTKIETNDYSFDKHGETYYTTCKCGDRYLHRGRRFLFVDQNGTEHPYLIWRPFRGWFPDESSVDKAVNGQSHQLLTFAKLDHEQGFPAPPPATADEPSLPAWYRAVREKPLEELSVADICRACRQEIHPQHVVPIALRLLEAEPTTGDMYDGELLVAMESIPRDYWLSHSAHAETLKSVCQKVQESANQPEDLRQNVADLIKRLTAAPSPR